MTAAQLVVRALSVLLAVALVALGVVVAVEVVLALLARPSWLVDRTSLAATLRDNTWHSGLARGAGAALCAVGLLLLVPALRLGKAAALPLAPGVPGVETLVSRRGLQRALRAAAVRVDGVRRADVKVGRRRVDVTAVSALRDTTGLSDRVEQEVQGTLQEIALRRAPALRVRTRRNT